VTSDHQERLECNLSKAYTTLGNNNRGGHPGKLYKRRSTIMASYSEIISARQRTRILELLGCNIQSTMSKTTFSSTRAVMGRVLDTRKNKGPTTRTRTLRIRVRVDPLGLLGPLLCFGLVLTSSSRALSSSCFYLY
jgi:hypothetical protein